MRTLFRLSVIVLSFWLIGRFCHKQTAGFAMTKIRSSFVYNSENILPIPPDYHEQLKKILEQPFYYLGSGAQTFVFVSADNQYVIKFFRHDRRRHCLAPIVFLLPTPFRNHLKKTIEKRHLKVLKDYASYELAYNLLREDTGLVFLHLDKSYAFPVSLSLYDKIGIKHTLPLEEYEFIIQKKAQLLYPTLEQWIAENALEKAQEGISNLIDLLVKRCKWGIFDKDPDLQTNFGFINKNPIQIDVGRFSVDPSRADPAVYLSDIIRITDPLKYWLKIHSPQLAEYLQHELESLQKKL